MDRQTQHKHWLNRITTFNQIAHAPNCRVVEYVGGCGHVVVVDRRKHNELGAQFECRSVLDDDGMAQMERTMGSLNKQNAPRVPNQCRSMRASL